MKLFAFVCMFCASLFTAHAAMAAPDMAGMDHGSSSAGASATYSDKAFLSGMIAHHEGAVDMAKIIIKAPAKGQDSQIRKWAEDIIKEQDKEIAMMHQMLKKMGGLDKEAYAHMKASMDEMLKVREHNGGMEVHFIQQMLPHHAGALEMSIPALLHSSDKDVVKLAKEIITAQTKEIVDFRKWLAVHTR